MTPGSFLKSSESDQKLTGNDTYNQPKVTKNLAGFTKLNFLLI